MSPIPTISLAPRAKPTEQETLAQVRAILDSPALQSAESSRNLLEFLAAWSKDHSGSHVKESEIAIAVFHREPSEFDAQTDSVVRVQMARLRKKISEYYQEFGREDEVVLDIPKGSYSLVRSYRTVAAAEIEKVTAPPMDLPPVAKTTSNARAVWLAFAGMGAGVILTFLFSKASEAGAVPVHVRQFWSQVLQKDSANVVVFPNPRLAGTLAIEGLRYFEEGRDSQHPATENLSYTGAADVESVATLMHLFDTMHSDLKVRSGALLSWDQAKESNLIFIGRPEQNPALRQLPRLPEFYFRFAIGIVNAHPRSGEQDVYACSRRPYSHDYAIIALIPGLNRNLKTLILAGNTTYGSLAAAEFVSNENSIATLFNQLGVKSGEKMPYFEALLEVRINNLTPVWSKLIAMRTFSADRSAWTPPLESER